MLYDEVETNTGKSHITLIITIPNSSVINFLQCAKEKKKRREFLHDL